MASAIAFSITSEAKTPMVLTSDRRGHRGLGEEEHRHARLGIIILCISDAYPQKLGERLRFYYTFHIIVIIIAVCRVNSKSLFIIVLRTGRK